jgi:hypothetical protein
VPISVIKEGTDNPPREIFGHFKQGHLHA